MFGVINHRYRRLELFVNLKSDKTHVKTDRVFLNEEAVAVKVVGCNDSETSIEIEEPSAMMLLQSNVKFDFRIAVTNDGQAFVPGSNILLQTLDACASYASADVHARQAAK